MKKKVFIAGHNGMVGKALQRVIGNDDYELITPTHKELDLINQNEVDIFLRKTKPDFVYLAAGLVGGIYANSSHPVEFLYNNSMIQNNVIFSSLKSNVKRLIFFASSSAYPKFSEQPIKETSLLTGSLEPTNESYSIAKISGIKLCESINKQYGSDLGIHYQSLMPSNLYGEGDKYDSLNGHVIPSLIKKIHEAKIKKSDSVELWGTGKPKREFLYVDDLAEAANFIMRLPQSKLTELPPNLNVGIGIDITISELANYITKIIGFEGNIVFNSNMPDGVPRKILDSSIINQLGWSSKVGLEQGIQRTYQSFLKNNSF